jgi:hypothetical protein
MVSISLELISEDSQDVSLVWTGKMLHLNWSTSVEGGDINSELVIDLVSLLQVHEDTW